MTSRRDPAAAGQAPTRLTGVRMRAVPLVLAVPLFLQNIDTTVMTTALPSIANALQVNVLSLNLAITAYLVSLAVFLPMSGWLADRMGAKRMFCCAIVLFSAASTLCGFAQSLPQLVVCRLAQGLGGALMLPLGRLILLRTVPASLMVAATVWFTVPSAVGRLIGPFVGGAIVTLASWRWIFLINVPFALASLGLAAWLLPRDPPADATRATRFDTLGFVLLAGGLVGVLAAVETAGKDLVPVWGTAAAGVAGVAMLWGYWRHARSHPDPLIDLAILRFRTYRAAVVGGLPLRIAIGAAPFLLPLMLQLGFGLSPIESGSLTMAMAVGALGTRVVVAPAIRILGFRTLLLCAAFTTSLFYMAYGFFTPRTPHLLMFCVMALGGLVNSMAMVSLNTLGYADIPPDRVSHATATASMAQQLSASLGVVLGAGLLAVISIWHSGQPGKLHAGDFMPAFMAVGIMTLISFAAFRHLDPNEGEALRGRRPD